MDDRRHHRRSAYLLSLCGVGCLCIALSPGRITSLDAGERLVIANQLWTSGTVFVDDATAMLFSEHGYTSYTGIGQSLVFIPFDMLGHALAWVLGLEGLDADRVATLPVVFLYTLGVALAWFWAAVRLSEELGTSQETALLAAWVLVLASPVGHYAFQTVQEEAVVGALVAACTVGALGWLRTRGNRYAAFSGAAAGAAVLFRLNVLFALIVPLAVVIEGIRCRPTPFATVRKGCVAALVGLAAPAGLWLLFNFWRYGNLFAAGHQLLLEREGRQLFHGPSLSVAAALLVGPGKGLLVTAPVLLFATLGLLQRRGGWRWSRATLGLTLCGSLIFHSALYRGAADGSISWGCRYQVHLLSLFVFPLALGLNAVRRLRYGGVLLAVAFLAGLGVNGLGVMAPDSLEYFQIQAAKGAYSDEPLMGVTEGQIASRASNVVRWLRSDFSPASADNELGKAIRRMERAYMPNIWGPVYAKRLGDTRAATLVAAVWGLVLVTGIMLWLAACRMAFKRMRKAAEPPAP